MLCKEILVDILNDGGGHHLVTEQACIGLYRILALAGLNECLVVLVFLSGQLTEATLCKDVSVTVCGFKVSLNSCSDRLSELLKRTLHDFRCGVFRIKCSLKGCCSFCNHRILSQHFLNPP